MKDNGIPTDALESGKKKLLIVDDDQDLVELLVDAFERDGRFELRTANNGFDAGMQVKEFRPDAVILDVMLPISMAARFANESEAIRRSTPSRSSAFPGWLKMTRSLISSRLVLMTSCRSHSRRRNSSNASVIY